MKKREASIRIRVGSKVWKVSYIRGEPPWFSFNSSRAANASHYLPAIGRLTAHDGSCFCLGVNNRVRATYTPLNSADRQLWRPISDPSVERIVLYRSSNLQAGRVKVWLNCNREKIQQAIQQAELEAVQVTLRSLFD